MEVLFLIGIALAPGAAIGLFIWLKDLYEREPLKHLLVSFILGVLSSVPAMFLSFVGLVISIRLCFKAMKAHNERSPFKSLSYFKHIYYLST